MKIPDRAAYDRLPIGEKEVLLRQIARETGAEWRGMASFACWGRSLETGLFALKGRTLVFVPGGPVTLGWGGFSGEEDPAFREALEEDVREYWGGQYQAEEIIGLLTSQVREAVLPPLLADRKSVV